MVLGKSVSIQCSNGCSPSEPQRHSSNIHKCFERNDEKGIYVNVLPPWTFQHEPTLSRKLKERHCCYESRLSACYVGRCRPNPSRSLAAENVKCFFNCSSVTKTLGACLRFHMKKLKTSIFYEICKGSTL